MTDPTPDPMNRIIPMTEQTEAEQFLLSGIRAGDAGAWGQLVGRYQGRLLAFARCRGVKGADADDLVQETFLQFLRSLPAFQARSSVETYLFVILRRRVADHFRSPGQGRKAQRRGQESSEGGASDASEAIVSPDLNASGYARRDEQREAAKDALSRAVRSLAAKMEADFNFRDLQVAEALFHAHLPNKQAAALCSVEEPFVALLKHRWLKQLRERVAGSLRGAAPEDSSALDSLLTEVWEELRPGCPKRSTLGAYLLGTLDAPWMTYVEAHVQSLGCPLCQANVKDLQEQTATDAASLHRRIVDSTIGFLRRPTPGK